MCNSPSFCCPKCRDVFSTETVEEPSTCPLCKYPVQIEYIPTSPTILSRYQLVDMIGKGGMGEVLLAFDTTYGRRIALKKIRSDLLSHPQIRHRFLKEAHITAQLIHPAIIPIYSIQEDPSLTYYTMPFVEGETLKQIIRKTRNQEKKGEKLDHIGGSIPALMRIFITICQAIAYAHSKNVLHRDLKLENIIIGKYGEVVILDWGLAKYINNFEIEEELETSFVVPNRSKSQITRTGKVVGTIAYMAPERAFGQPATISTDIYALGVILYQLLTLTPPFNRGKLKDFRENIRTEELENPVLRAPYRDVPRILARITEKCLYRTVHERYVSVDELIYDMENYLEGRSEWFQVAELAIHRKEDWEFQEHVLLAEHVAVTRITEESEWVSLMVSSQSFTGNTRIETTVCLEEGSEGIGILLSVPEAASRTTIRDGYCLWIGSDQYRSTKLLRSNVEVIYAPDIFLKRKQLSRIRIEKIDKTIHLYLNDTLQFSYIAHLPLIGTHIGFLSRDTHFTLTPIIVSVGSLNLTINCLAVPDAFLAHRDFEQALSEYRRIAYSFPDRVEGREAVFRSGLTFIEQAKTSVNSNFLFNQALEEFEKLHHTPGAPLEYLGKALVYQTLQEYEEEIKCFELAYRRYPKHPLLPILQEQILSRLHVVSRQKRITTYQFILLIVRHFPTSAIDTHTHRLFTSLQKHWEILPFIEQTQDPRFPLIRFATNLSFWLAKPYVLGEILNEICTQKPFAFIEIGNVFASLLQLGAWQYAQKKLYAIQSIIDLPNDLIEDLEAMCACHREPLIKVLSDLSKIKEAQVSFSRMRALLYLLDRALDQKLTTIVHTTLDFLEKKQLSFEDKIQLNSQRIWAFLIEKNWQQAGELIYTYPVELLNADTTLLHFLYGCWLQAIEGKEMAFIHFTGVLQMPYPRSWTLGSHALIAEPSLYNTWLDKAFIWEKRHAYRQLALYFHCAHQEMQSKQFFNLYQQQFLNDHTE
jgi:serine/threonine protein kinase/tetratricopeptide (TPR) repeat protein